MEDILKIETGLTKLVISKIVKRYINKKLNKNISFDIDKLSVIHDSEGVCIRAAVTASMSEDELKKFVKEALP